MTRINTNVSSLNAQKTLQRSNATLQQSLTRLSTGLRINAGKDDPAGLIASETLRSDIVSVQRAITNSERANQMIATADSALGQVSGLLNDIRGLVTEAANDGAMSADQLAANQLQIDSSLEAINRIAQTTSFQGKRLLDGSLDFLTTATTVSSITDLQIDQANLGTAGRIDVEVDIQAAATQAKITSASGEAKASSTLNFAARGVSAMTTDAGAGSLYVRALSSSSEYEGVLVDFTGAAASTAATYDSSTKTLSVSVANLATVGQIKSAIAATGLFEASSDQADTAAIDTGGAGVYPADIARVDFTRESLKIEANTAGIDFNNMEVSLVTKASGNASANYYSDTNRLVISVSSAATSALGGANSLEAAVEAVVDSSGTALFTATASDNTALVDGRGTSDPRIVGNTGGTGYLASGFSAATNANGTLTFAAGAGITITTDTNTSILDIKAKLLGDTENQVRIEFVRDASSAANTSVEYDRNNKVMKVHYFNNGGGGGDDTTVQNVIDKINGTTGVKEYFEAKSRTGDAAEAIAAGYAGTVSTTGSDTLKITSLIPGASFNGMQINLVRKDGQGATTPKAEYLSATNVMQITVDSTATTSLVSIAEAVNKVSGFSAYVDDKGSGRIFGANDEATVTANTGTTGGNTLLADTVLEVAGKDGMEVFNFGAGASINQVVSAVNLVADATGITASQQNGVLTLSSTAYGSKGLVAVDVRSEGTGGTFKSALSAARATGSDVQATINGVAANADGNTMSINTATLDLKLTVAAGSSSDFEFSISGGGALFQLGPDVVSNQQARIGITSLNTARLGGTNGKLYQLSSGGEAAVATNATKAAAIVDETIAKVTSLRGRLGAFQRTTLDTNISSLNDTLENLTAAESSIRDADFAAESANLTRAQILVQSGTSVLGIANQNPQNVLSLLR